VHRRRSAAIAALALLLTTSGCALLGPGESCVEWVQYESDERLREAVDAVIVVEAPERDGDAWLHGAPMHAYRVEALAVEQGDVAVGDELRVVSMAQTCSGADYPDGDPLDDDGPLRLFLQQIDGVWRTPTPYAGVEPA
jgi:hypothetical protein